jgi:hypothetical protein
VSQFHAALAAIDRGIDGPDGKPTGILYTERTNSAEGTSSERWAGHVLIDHLGVDQARAKIILKDWLANGVLVRTEFTDPRFRKTYKGLKVDPAKIPGTDEGGGISDALIDHQAAAQMRGGSSGLLRKTTAPEPRR